MTPPLSKVSENIPVKSLIAFTQTVVGFGAGLLIADKLGRPARQRTALALFGAGVAAFLPVAFNIVFQVINDPDSERNMRRKLDGIRRAPGVDDQTF